MSVLRSVDSLNHSPEALALFAGAASADESSSNAFLAVAASSAQKIEPEYLGDALVAFPRKGGSPVER